MNYWQNIFRHNYVFFHHSIDFYLMVGFNLRITDEIDRIFSIFTPKNTRLLVAVFYVGLAFVRKSRFCY